MSKISKYVVDKYFSNNNGSVLVEHLINSYNDFILRKIDDVIEGFNKGPIEIPHQFLPEYECYKYILKLCISNPILLKPMIVEKDGSTKLMTPADARNRNLTYSSNLHVDLYIQALVFNEETKSYMEESKKITNINLGKIPIMVKSNYCILSTTNIESNECRYDYGGYFIVGGTEKCLICQDRIAENIINVFPKNKNSNMYSHTAEIRSIKQNTFGVPKTNTLKLTSKANQFGRAVRVNIHHIKHDIPITILFRALGIQSDKEIVKYILLHESDNPLLLKELAGSFEEGNIVSCQRDAYEYLNRYMVINGYNKDLHSNKAKRLEIITNILTHEFLPHVGTDFHKKALFLGAMMNKLLKCYLGLIPYDDRDSYINKRVDTPGILMANLFRQYYGKVIKDMKALVAKDLNSNTWKTSTKLINIINQINISRLFKSTIIESGMKFSLATGNWGIKSGKQKQGVAQVLNRLTYLATLSHLRRFNTPVDKTGKLIQPRKLHSTQYGVICPAETPEGVSVGLVKNMSMAASITIASNSSTIYELLKTGYHDIEPIIHFDGSNIDIFTKDATHIIVNGDLIGVHKNPCELFKFLKHQKVTGLINSSISIAWNILKNHISINTEGGRCIRPTIIVNENNTLSIDEDFMNNNLNISWNELCSTGKIEYIDLDEANSSMIAMNEKTLYAVPKPFEYSIRYTHMEIDPSLMLGVLAASIPFSNHNQAPRNCYQCLALHEEVLMADGTRKQIKDVQIGDTVVTFNIETMKPSISNVINQYVRNTDKKIYKIQTISGRSITATSNHPFMTNQGWKKVEELEIEKDCLGIYLQNTEYFKNDILDYPDSLLIDTYMLYKYNGKAISKLKSQNLLPLNLHHPKLPILMRLFGYSIARGIIVDKNEEYNISVFFDCIDDAYMFEEDLISLGIPLNSTVQKCNNGYLATYYDLSISCIFKYLQSFLQLSIMPIWLKEGPVYLKKEFLNGYQSGMYFIENYNNLHNMYESLQMDAISPTTIGFKYSKACTLQYGIMNEYNMSKKTAFNASFNDFKTLVGEPKAYTIFVPIMSIVQVENQLISDITVESNNHSFISTGGIMSSNSAMGKQAIGLPTTNFQERYDTVCHTLNYPQKPIVQTDMAKRVNNDKLPCGANVIVAISTYTGFNQEDSLMMNKAAIDRGLFSSTHYKTYKEQNNKNHSTGEEEFFTKPCPKTTKNMKPFNYDKLNESGFIKENTFVDSGDIIIGKCMPVKDDVSIQNKDVSVVIKNNENGYIDKNYNSTNDNHTNGEGYTYCKVRIRNTRVPCIGDKFCLPKKAKVLIQNPVSNEMYWKSISKVSLDDFVFQLDPKTNHASFGKISNIYEFAHKGDMYHIKGNNCDLLVTPEHRMACFDNTGTCYLRLAKNLTGTEVFSTNCNSADIIQSKHICDDFENDMAYTYGLLKYRGFIDTIKEYIQIPSTPTLINILEKWRITYNYHVYTSTFVQIHNTHMIQRFKGLFVNDWVLYDKSTSEAFLKGYFEINQYKFASKDIANILQIIGFKAGININHCKDPDNPRLYHVYMATTEMSHYNVTKEFYDNMVYCIECPTHVFMVQYNGKCMWTGNSSRHGQKGTVGMIYSQEDMPFTKDGLVPDIIVNPHAIPSRMTIAQLMECIMCKASCVHGTMGNGSPFQDLSVEDIADALELAGLERYGNEVMYNPRTGEQMNTDIFIGPTYYQKLKHMVRDKIHSRSSCGPVVLITRQPAEGRARDGGLRLGEMEVECNLAHGISSFLKERFVECSDNYRIFVCKKCKYMSIVNPEKNIYNCKSCKNSTQFAECRIPYASKLLVQEVQTMSIGTKFIT